MAREISQTNPLQLIESHVDFRYKKVCRVVCVATMLDSVGLATTFREKRDGCRNPRIHCLSVIKANDNLRSDDRSIDRSSDSTDRTLERTASDLDKSSK